MHRPEAWLERSIDAEQTDRQFESLRYQLKSGGVPIDRDLLVIDWVETPLSQSVVEQLATASLMETAYNPLLVGGTDTGKSYLATPIGVDAIHQFKRIRFFNVVDLVDWLEPEKGLCTVRNLAKQLCLLML